MSAVPTGLLLPQSVLNSPTFTVFSVFVALNTVIYLGLTVAKFIPWPAQVHPRTVRAAVPDRLLEEDFMSRPPRPRPGPDDIEQRLRRDTARQTIPLAVALVGGLAVVAGLINTALYLAEGGAISLVGVVLGLVLIVLAQVLSRSSAPDGVMVWSWTVVMLVLVSETAWRAVVLDSAVVLAYAVIALIVIAPIALSWRAGAIGASVGGIVIIVAGAFVSLVDTASWAIAAVTAAVASLVLLQLRLTTIARLAVEEANSQALRSTDPVTGAFSRAGLLALAPTVAASAERAQTSVSVVACDLQDLAQENAEYGMEYGDDLLAATARALRASLPADAIVARWSGPRFLAIMQGSPADPHEVSRSVQAALATSGVTLGKRPAKVTVGIATGSPESTTFEVLAENAETESAQQQT